MIEQSEILHGSAISQQFPREAEGVFLKEEAEGELAWWHEVTKVPGAPSRNPGERPLVVVAKRYVPRKSQTSKEIREMRKHQGVQS